MEDLPKNVLTAYFDPSVVQESRVCDSYVREVCKDEKGNEYVKYVPFDSKKYQEELGSIELWSLESLVKAGIDPKFGIRTGYSTRMESEVIVNGIVDSIINEVDNSKNE